MLAQPIGTVVMAVSATQVIGWLHWHHKFDTCEVLSVDFIRFIPINVDYKLEVRKLFGVGAFSSRALKSDF